MKISLSLEGCKKHNISIGEVLFLLFINSKESKEKVIDNLISKGYITADRDSLFQEIGYRVTNKGNEIIDSVILDSENTSNNEEERLTDLAKGLKEIFPKGKKEGTNYYWAEGVALIVRRLKLFFKKYGNEYSDEQILKAAKKYVQGFNGNYMYMKILRYFILKEKIGAAGEVEGESELINYIENDGQEDELRNDWTSTLV